MAEARDVFKEYIKVRKLIGEEESQWREEKRMLQDMIRIVESEIEQLNSRIEELEESSTAADKERAELQAELEAAREVSIAFNDDISRFETAVLELSSMLPASLLDEIQPLMARIPKDKSETRLSYSQRLQSVVGILAQIDKFNSDLTYSTVIESLDGGSFEVQTLYFGLGAALFSDTEGNYAGYGVPTKDGWKFTKVSGPDGDAITRAIDIYMSKAAPQFVSVPFHID